MMEKNMLEIVKYMRYMDDGRLFMAPLMRGWRWNRGELLFTKRWAEEDKE